MAKGKKINGIKVDFSGMSDLLNKIEKAGGNVESAVGQAVKRSVIPVRKDMQSFMARHHLTGQTEESWHETPLEFKNGVLKYKMGYSISRGGIAALFLDIGTPTIAPSFFIYTAVESNRQAILEEQQKALEENFKELL